jgi:chaperonin GroEL (HSP60 family)
MKIKSKDFCVKEGDRGYISPYFVTNAEKMRVEMEDAYLLVYEKKLFGLQSDEVRRPANSNSPQTRTSIGLIANSYAIKSC